MIKLTMTVSIMLFATVAASAVMAEDKTENEPKVLTGMSIVGNSEAPKSLTIVPWKNLDIVGTGKPVQLAPNPLIEELSPIDKNVFMRELEFYKLSNPTN
ncbi:MAG: hypothetical protein Q7S51_01280 [Gallionellaceae bacterium]|nr:hypothetical protein [Gallionellaceae bacterium]